MVVPPAALRTLVAAVFSHASDYVLVGMLCTRYWELRAGVYYIVAVIRNRAGVSLFPLDSGRAAHCWWGTDEAASALYTQTPMANRHIHRNPPHTVYAQRNWK